MKKYLSLILAIILVAATFSACGKEKSENTESNPDNATVTSTEETTKKAEKPVKYADFETEVYEVPLHKIVINMPSSPYHSQELAYTKAYFKYDEQCISLTVNLDGVATNLKDAQKECIDCYNLTISNYADIDSLTVEEEKNVKINGIDMYRFEGIFNCKREAGDGTHKQYVVGYTFIMDGIPCSLIGTTLTRRGDVPESVNKDIENKVDTLIKTIRMEE